MKVGSNLVVHYPATASKLDFAPFEEVPEGPLLARGGSWIIPPHAEEEDLDGDPFSAKAGVTGGVSARPQGPEDRIVNVPHAEVLLFVTAVIVLAYGMCPPGVLVRVREDHHADGGWSGGGKSVQQDDKVHPGLYRYLFEGLISDIGGKPGKQGDKVHPGRALQVSI